MTRSCSALFLLFLLAGQSECQTVLLAAHRSGWVEAFDSNSLQPLGTLKVLPQLNGVTSDQTGVLFLQEGISPDFQGCCALYAVDLKTRKMTKLSEPSDKVALSPDGFHVLTQRGDVGIEVYGVRNMQREPGIPRSVAPGVYALSFSPDGQLLFGVSNFPAASLDIFDFEQRNLVQRFNISQKLIVSGTWVGPSYYVYGHRHSVGQLWRVKADNSGMDGPMKIEFPDTVPECEMTNQQVLGVDDKLFLYEVFGAKLDRRNGCSREIPGGLLSVDPQTGALLARLAPEIHFASLISGENGKELYGLDVMDTNWTSVNLVRLNATSGEVLARRNLASDVWFIDLATIPSELVPRGSLEAR